MGEERWVSPALAKAGNADRVRTEAIDQAVDLSIAHPRHIAKTEYHTIELIGQLGHTRVDGSADATLVFRIVDPVYLPPLQYLLQGAGSWPVTT